MEFHNNWRKKLMSLDNSEFGIMFEVCINRVVGI